MGPKVFIPWAEEIMNFNGISPGFTVTKIFTKRPRHPG